MADLNEVAVIGRLTRDPESRITANGKNVCSFGVATNRRWKDSSGDRKEETTFLDITVWGSLADNCSKYLTKGKEIFLKGSLRNDSWEKDGVRHTKTYIVADNVQFLFKLGDQKD